MADPVITPCTKDAFTKIATNVTSIRAFALDFAPTAYLWTYRDTGGAAPSSQAELVPFVDRLEETFAVAADVYVYPKSKDGSIRVDAP